VPRYFFNLVDNGREDDDEGMELQGAAAARAAGISMPGRCSATNRIFSTAAGRCVSR